MGNIRIGLPNRLILYAVVLCALWIGVVCPDAAEALTPFNSLIRNTVTITSEAFEWAPADTAACETWVTSWISVSTDSSGVEQGNGGETIWIPYAVSNLAGVSDTFAMSVGSDTGWPVTIWDSAGLAGSPILVTDSFVIAAQDSMLIQIAIYLPSDSGSNLGDSVTFTARSVSDPNVSDSLVASVYMRGRLDHFVINHPAAVYAGVPFGITVTACDADSNALVDYDTEALLHVDTGTVTDTFLAQATWAAGIWNGNITFADCIDTVYLSVQDGNVAETVSIRVINYRITLDKLVYRGVDDMMLITVFDSGQDTPTVINTVDVLLASDADAVGITVTLTETGLATATFTGNIGFTQGMSRADAIRVDSNGNFTVTYDPDGPGGAPEVVAAASWIAFAVDNLEAVRSWPNPFRPNEDGEVVIHKLPPDENMVIEIYNVAAQRVRTLTVPYDITVTLEENIARWDGTSTGGGDVASGTYVYLVRSSFGNVTRKLTLIR